MYAHAAARQRFLYSQSSHKQTPHEFKKVGVIRAGCLKEYALVSNPMVKQSREVAYDSFRNSIVIHKEKN